MDLFARTFLPAAADAGLSMPTISRHIVIFRRCVGAANPVLTVVRCVRADRPLAGPHVLVLSPQRLVVTHESRVVHRIRLHLDAALSELSAISWTSDPRRGALELVATSVDGVRERFWIPARHPKSVAVLEATLGYLSRTAGHAFAPTGEAARPRPAAA
jgi:hypothetical protein